jgi:hypothetical protein
MCRACGNEIPDAGSDAGPQPSDAGIDSGTPDASAPPLGPYGSRTFTVEATTYWTSSGLYVEPGTEVTFSANGVWSSWFGTQPLHGPGGVAGQLVNGCPWGSLVASVGLPINGLFICVGAGLAFTADAGGIVYLGPSDYGLDDNGGALQVTVTSTGAQVPTIDAGDLAGYDFTRVSAPQIELAHGHVLLTVPTALAKKYVTTAPAALVNFEQWYEQHAALAGARPYHGQPIRFVPDEGVRAIGAWMVSGNPIRIDPKTLDGMAGGENLLQSADPKFSVWGFPHEMGHDFSFINEGRYMVGPGPIEAWANVFTVHALEKLSHPEANLSTRCMGVPAHLASGTYAGFKADPWLPLCMLMELKTKYGWVLFEKFLQSYNTIDLATVPATTAADGVRWAWIRDRFNAITGEDTTAVFQKFKVPLS